MFYNAWDNKNRWRVLFTWPCKFEVFFFLLYVLSCYLSAVLFFAYVFKHRQNKSAVFSASFVYFRICKRKAFFRASNFEINKPLFFIHSFQFVRLNILSSSVLQLDFALHVEHYAHLTFRHRASCILGQSFHYSPENALYIFNQQIYFIIWYLLDHASLI